MVHLVTVAQGMAALQAVAADAVEYLHQLKQVLAFCFEYYPLGMAAVLVPDMLGQEAVLVFDMDDNLLVLVPGSMPDQWVVVDPGWSFAAVLDMVDAPASEMVPGIVDQKLMPGLGILDLFVEVAPASALADQEVI